MIEEVFIAIAVNQDGDEGIIGKVLPRIGAVPMVTTDRETAEALLDDLQGIIAGTGEEVDIVRFVRAGSIVKGGP